ncbi:hypothetical protein [Taklimakanibacter deserti]|uniref:hypothetical protein n=1 Tax=Taklimakanibacter deserti TaxID=2267839 RepID=UPI000E6539E0
MTLAPGDIELLVTTARESYVRQFIAFAKNQQSKCHRGAAEVKMEIGGTSGFFEDLCCADFVMNDDQVRVVELAPDDELSFDPVEGKYGSVSLRVRNLQWDDVVLRHDLGELPHAQLKRWFER